MHVHVNRPDHVVLLAFGSRRHCLRSARLLRPDVPQSCHRLDAYGCWAHLLRDIHDLKTASPDDASLADWATAVRAVYDAARAFGDADPRARSAAPHQFQERLVAVCTPFVDDPAAVQAKLCRRIQRHSDERFVFVAHPDVPSDNNAAERSIRPLVTSRKISGGTRSDRGSATKMTLASLFSTWDARSLNPFDQCYALLTSPQA
jgi:hypothetical protein